MRSSESCKVAVLRKSRKGYPCWTSFQEWGNIFLKNHVQTLIGPFFVNQDVAYFQPKPYPAILPPPLSPDPSLEIREGGWWSSRPLDKGRGGQSPPKNLFWPFRPHFGPKIRGVGHFPGSTTASGGRVSSNSEILTHPLSWECNKEISTLHEPIFFVSKQSVIRKCLTKDRKLLFELFIIFFTSLCVCLFVTKHSCMGEKDKRLKCHKFNCLFFT